MKKMEVVTVASNAVHARLHEASREVKLLVQSALSYLVADAENVAFKSGGWDGRSSFLDFRTGSFPAGFAHYVVGRLIDLGYEVRHVRKPLPLPLGPENPKVDAFAEDSRYDFQMETVRRLVKHGQCIAQVATGGGKSRIARLAFARINRPTLFLTTRGVLMYQMKRVFEKELGIECSVLGDGLFGKADAEGRQFITQMNVGMVQTFVSRLRETSVVDEFESLYSAVEKKHTNEVTALRRRLTASHASVATATRAVNKLVVMQQENLEKAIEFMQAKAERKFAEHEALRSQTINLLAKFEFVILEEAHESSGNGYFEVMKHCKNAFYRLALTATPFMKDDEEANMRLMASSGPIAIKVSEKTLIDRGILATPKFKTVHLTKQPTNLLRGTPWQAAYRLGIVDCDERNAAIVNEVINASRYGLSAMILTQQTRHGERLQVLLEQAGLRSLFIQGVDDQDERQKALTLLAEGQIDALVGTSILDVGVDVPAVGMIILAGGGKAEVALRQRIGRGLRAKKSGPNVALVVDFDDNYNYTLKGHYAQRHAIIKDTEGFNENILPLGQDFDYSVFQAVPQAA